MAATKRFMNWTAVGFAATGGGGSATFTGVTNVDINPNGSIATFSGDGDHYATTQVSEFADPEITVTCADLAAINSIPLGSRGTVTATHNDAKNQAAAGGGGIVYTMTNAIVSDKKIGGQHRQFGTGTITFKAESLDGTTNPIATTAA